MKFSNRTVVLTALVLSLVAANLAMVACDEPSERQLQGVQVNVNKGADSLTIEQRNIKDRVVEDNKPGAIKHLYVISAYSGQVLLYSTVRGKVTSSSKRLDPSSVSYNTAEGGAGFRTKLTDGNIVYSSEVRGVDGTYGSSVEYIYWWDSKGDYHQHYIQGGQIVHVASSPIAVKSVVLNLEARTE